MPPADYGRTDLFVAHVAQDIQSAGVEAVIYTNGEPVGGEEITLPQLYWSDRSRSKGTHLAIEVAKRNGIPLRIAGEVQPAKREYFERKIKPDIDGNLVEYIGPANLEARNELSGTL